MEVSNVNITQASTTSTTSIALSDEAKALARVRQLEKWLIKDVLKGQDLLDVSPAYLINMADLFQLTRSDVEEVCAIRRDYGAGIVRIFDLLQENFTPQEVRKLYEVRQYVKEVTEENLSLKQLTRYLKTFVGAPDLSSQCLGDSIIDLADGYVSTTLKRLCDFVEREHLEVAYPEAALNELRRSRDPSRYSVWGSLDVPDYADENSFPEENRS